MEKLKYIKIEYEDGTLSENVPIGADTSIFDDNWHKYVVKGVKI